ncbi:hypothetical protein Q9Q99_05825 [Curtobacterium flaccumfaciens]|nr:hypothetical protein Q9Q99_05825 [Curtobacterium flaccumfaciens]
MPELLGRTVTGAPQAELWLGAHAGSPSVVVNPAMVGGADTLRDWIADEPETALGPDRTDLPFLLKVLAAAAPLSLQAHPTPEQAAEGFAREEREGIPPRRPGAQLQGPVPEARARRRAERAVRGAERLPPRRGDPRRGARARRRHRTARSARGAPAARARGHRPLARDRRRVRTRRGAGRERPGRRPRRRPAHPEHRDRPRPGGQLAGRPRHRGLPAHAPCDASVRGRRCTCPPATSTRTSTGSASS